MADECTPRPMQLCEETLVEAAQRGYVPTPWSICLPWGGQLYQDETGVHVREGTPPPDGVYDRIVVVNGCIVNVRKSDAPTYVGSPCAPLPGDCGGSGGSGGSSLCDASPTPGNLYRCDFSGRPLVTVTIQQGTGTIITGDGSLNNPYVISMSGGGSGGGIYLRSDNEAIALTGSGTRDDPYILAHKAGLQTTANGMVFDAYGHLVDMGEGSVNTGVQGIIGGEGVKVDADPRTGIYTVGLEELLNNKQGDWLLGGYTVTLDKYNRIFNIGQTINLGGEQTFTCGDKKVTVNALGSITNIQPAEAAASSGGLVTSILWDGVRPFEFDYRLEADFILPANMQIVGVLYAPSMPSGVFVDGASMTFNNSAFWTAPAWLSQGGHHIQLIWPQTSEDAPITRFMVSPATMLIFDASNPVYINMQDSRLPWE